MKQLFFLAHIRACAALSLRLSFDPPYRRAGLVFKDRELVVETDDLSDEQVERLLLDPAIGIFGDSDELDRTAAEAAEAERIAQAEAERIAAADAEKAKQAEAAEAERIAQAEAERIAAADAEKAKQAEAAEAERIAQAEAERIAAADAEKAKQAEAAEAERVAKAEDVAHAVASKPRKGKDNG